MKKRIRWAVCVGYALAGLAGLLLADWERTASQPEGLDRGWSVRQPVYLDQYTAATW